MRNGRAIDGHRRAALDEKIAKLTTGKVGIEGSLKNFHLYPIGGRSRETQGDAHSTSMS